jgi:hypothetical protein
MQCSTDLTQVVQTFRVGRSSAGALNSWKQKPNQQPNQANHNKYFDSGKPSR